MAIFRGIGGAGDSTTDATVTEVTQKAVDAAASATSAQSSATAAEASATSSAQYAGQAFGQAQIAENARTNAEGFANDALAYRNQAEDLKVEAGLSALSASLAFDSFDDRYLGAKSSSPTVDNDGNALLDGALYFDTTDSVFYGWNGTIWIPLGAELSLDASPQLSADLDLNTHDITGTGNINITGTVNGRNLTTDGSKIDGIEANATADQTAAEIRTLVESASDSNVFTDADHSKLDGIEANATADQTDSEIKTAYENNADTNAFTDAEQSKLSGIESGATADQTASEIKTAYESNSDTNVFTDAEQTKLSNIEANATADQTASEIKTAYESNSDTNVFTDSEKSKLSNIEDNADVTDATNVTAAGALMDSEVTNLDQVKAFSSSDYATAAQGTTADNALPKAGGTMTGAITLSGAPTQNNHAVTKTYVDSLIAAGIHYHDPVRVEVPDDVGSLNATYDNGTNGVGATLTNAGTQEALVIDGVTLVTSDRVLIYNQSNTFENGIYTVTNVGSASTNWVLTRATDADSYGVDNNSLSEGTSVFVTEGDSGSGEVYACTTTGTITFGTTAINFSQIGKSAVLTGGTGITVDGNEINVTNNSIGATQLNVSGNGATSQFLRSDGDGTFTWATPTDTNTTYSAGSGLSLAGTTFSNTAPDQTVSLAGSGATTVSGTYPNFTISSTDTNTTYSVGDGGLTQVNFTTERRDKLNAIETGATADQTAGEIKTAYESNTNTNAFTDSEKSKLSGIETGATADQTDSEIKTAYESNANTNAFTDAEQSKLSGIESGATADQTASEILTAIKTVDGTGSGLDADTLDGLQATAFATAAQGTTADNALPKSGGTMTGVLNTGDQYIAMQENHFINRRFEMIENASPQWILLCRNGANNDVNGTIRMDRTSGNYQASIVDVIVTSGSTAIYGGCLRTLQVIQQSEDYRLVSVTYDGNSWIAVKYTGNTYPETTGAYFTGRIYTSAGTPLTVVSSGITNEASFGGTSESYNEVDSFVVSGNIQVGGTVDGRDVAADGTKLDGIEASADVTDTANVTAAGALMDSEVTNLAQVKAFDSSDYATAAQGATADSALQNISEDTTPQLGGNLDTNGYEISFDDDKYLKFGASNDITIGHLSTYNANTIDAAGTLVLSSDSNILFKKGNLFGEALAQMASDGVVKLYYDGSARFDTTSTGIKTYGNIDVNGAYTLPTSDGTNGQVLTTDGSGAVTFQDASGGGSSLTIKDEGTALSTAATTINFTGSGVTATGTGAEKTVNIPSVAKYTEFDLAPGATSVTLTLSGDSDVQKVELRLAAKTYSSGPNNPTFTVKTSGNVNHQWDIQGMKMYNYTDAVTGLHVDGTTDLYSFLNYYNDFNAPAVFTFYKSEGGRWTCEATMAAGNGTTGTSYVLHCRTDFGFSYSDIGSFVITTGSSYNWITFDGTIVEYYK